ncbi:MAG: hypothetical protein HY099_04350 [Nitrospirae bacterium]|nr:hypothetical protein [Nitrospirota bacterium]
MQSKFNTNVEINKVGIEFTDKKITAYDGLCGGRQSFFTFVVSRLSGSTVSAVCRGDVAVSIHDPERYFKRIGSIKAVETLAEGLWGYLSELIPWGAIVEDWLAFDSTVLERHGKQEGIQP